MTHEVNEGRKSGNPETVSQDTSMDQAGDEKGRTGRVVVETKRSGLIKVHFGDRINQFYGLGHASPEKRDSWFLVHKRDSLPWARFS